MNYLYCILYYNSSRNKLYFSYIVYLTVSNAEPAFDNESSKNYEEFPLTNETKY